MANEPTVYRPTVLASLALCAVCSGGLAFWNPVTDDEVLWTPYGSEVSEKYHS